MKHPWMLIFVLTGSALAEPAWETWVRRDGSLFEGRVRQVVPGEVTFALRTGGEQTVPTVQLAERSRRRLAEVLGLETGAAAEPVTATPASPTSADVIDASDEGALESRYGQKATVTGTLRRVATLGTSGHRLLEFDGGVFSVFIRRADLEKHPDWSLDALTGKRVRVQGGIAKYRERLQIQVDRPDQLSAVE